MNSMDPDPAFAASPSSHSSVSRPSGLQSGVGFTPGPWRAVSDDGDWYVADKDRIVADIEPMVTSAVVEANANLIAAAPDLFEALIGMLPIVFTGSPTNAQNVAHWERERELGNGQAQTVLAAYAALAKARGEP